MSKQDRLDEEQFTYQVLKNGNVLIFWHGKQIQILSGTKAMMLAADLESAASDREVQMILAKITGNFKRGNEKIGRHGSKKPRF
jgi:hypothetical protein